MFRTIEEFIESKDSEPITFSTFSIYEKINGINFPVHNIINDYIDELLEFAIDIELEQKDANKYRYRPELLAFDVYGSERLDFVILALNNIDSAKNFNPISTIKLIQADQLHELLQLIFSSEEERLIENSYNNEDRDDLEYLL